MEYFLCFTYIVLFVGVIYKAPFFTIPGISKKLISGIFLLKIIAGFSLYLVYTYYYTDRNTADIFKYFDDSKILYDALLDAPKDSFKSFFSHSSDNPYLLKMKYWFNQYSDETYNDKRLVIIINALIRLVSLGYFSVHTVFFNFISLVGLVTMFKFFASLHINKKVLIFSIFLVPSVLFWSSGVLKESVLFLGLGLFLLYFSYLVQNKLTFNNIILCLVGLFILMLIKPYVLIAISLPLIAYACSLRTNIRRTVVNYCLVIIGGFSIMLLLIQFTPHYNLLKVISDKQNNFINITNGGVYLMDNKRNRAIYIPDDKRNNLIQIDRTHFKIKEGTNYSYQRYDEVVVSDGKTTYSSLFNQKKSGSLLNVNRLEPTFKSFIKETPKALLNAFFRPFLWESTTVFMLFCSLESLILVVFILLALFVGKKVNTVPINIILFSFSFSFILFLFVGLTTPLMGAIVRYKIPALPFTVISLLLLIDTKKLMNFICKE